MIVVTGATSNTGRAVALNLLEAGAQIRVVGRSLDRLQPFVSRGAEAFVAEPTDKEAMLRAFQGAEAAYVMLQPGFIADSEDFPAYQQAVIDAIVPALVQNGVRNIVALSGWGANYEHASGPLAGLRLLENRLQAESSLRVLVLRPGWFMENAIPLISAINNTGNASSQLRGNLRLPMIATSDIGAVAASSLLKPMKEGFEAREVQGPDELTLTEAADIIGQVTGVQGASYVQASPIDVKAEMLGAGFSDHMAEAFVIMSDDLNAERIIMLQPLEERIITRTGFETFVRHTLEIQ
ncbi:MULTISPECIES: NmrA family NAD(P)-binding protein [Paenibacillus]|jgi:uncharacterized protein YbjT (DUF2867 family)|uniref:NmrA-like domain-containing protein n=1 Tax=Paenibacillus barengoltzii G22 TaxID=1235795 RepID=R9LG29_9BACL|nr:MULTISPECIES: NAD(P)H-binding protein [Paenibacillus]EOS57291.1 hypothetical protein C812_01611 [Paenibacillus barengoltzii G22]MDU0332493.1 NAD(P)H-binding protein [Paenibacillus sp. 3LSP]